MEKVVIIGSGPAALTAAIYAARANCSPLLFEGFMAGGIPAGGQLMITTEVENFPGFPEGILGPDLMMRMREQSKKHGTRIETKTVTKTDLSQKPFKIFTETSVVESQTIIIATGATAKRLNLPGEEKLWQKGVSACAICDGALPIFRNKPIAVIGGGDAAVEEATHLTKYASKVFMIHRRHELRASYAMQQKAFQNEKIEIIWDTVATAILGENIVNGLRLKNVKKNTESTLEVSGLFYAIGHLPNTSFLNGQIELDENGYIKTMPGSTKTNAEGVFACGDVQDKRYRQAITAAGSGCMAALDAGRYLAEHA